MSKTKEHYFEQISEGMESKNPQPQPKVKVVYNLNWSLP